MLWLIFVILTTLAWAIYDLFFKVVEGEINYFLALLVIGLGQMIIALPFVIYYYLNGNLMQSMKGYELSALMGVLLGLGTVFFFYAFRQGAPASIAIPMYGVGAFMIGALGGILIFKEVFSLRLALGFLFGIASIILLGISA